MSDNGQVQLTIDGNVITVPEGTTIFDAARMNGIKIPTLCHLQNETPVGVCRVCVVDDGKRVLTASCVRQVTKDDKDKMVVSTNSDRVRNTRRTLVELLMSDHPSPCAREQHTEDCELEKMARAEGIVTPRFARRAVSRGQDPTSFVIAVDHDACILCDRCIRGCAEIRNNNVLGRFGKGYEAGIAFDNHLPMGESSCVSCGECMVDCPTGALTNKSVVAATLQGEAVETEDLQVLPYFQNVSGTFLDLNKKAVVRRHFRPGEVICREGEYGRTAFYIVEGRVQIFISAPMAHVKTDGGATGFFSSLTSRLRTRRQDHRTEEGQRRTIPIDAPVALPYDHPVAELHEGDLFGEMTCMSLYPRSATVVASTDCTVYEMLRNVLDIILRNKTMRAQLDEKYRRRALDDHLRSVPVFASLPKEFIDSLRDRVELVRYSKGDVICHQGDRADSFYLIRIGFVKVTEKYPGGELVQAYRGHGGYFGEIGLLSPDGRRTATCTALDHLEVVRIQAEDFRRMLEESPQVRKSLEAVAQQRLEENRQRLIQANTTDLEDFVTRGLMEAQSLLILDLEKCTRCDACVRACADAHDGVTRLVREGLRYDHYLVATSCRSCLDPLCMIGCPVAAIGRRESKEVIIEDWCIGCGLCARNCPYGNINMHSFEVQQDDPHAPGRQIAVVKKKATSCDLCTEHEEPSCVYACPHDAAHRVDPNEFFRQKLEVR